ncbi:MAG: ABC transporter ATP-binding protein [Variovorax sp.]|nr:MAG: ABC transporter ATP-binding protein [Variovorax sp.]
MSLSAQGISIRFGGLVALSGVGVSVDPGTVTGLVGPNGAGKTTLFNCLTGVAMPQEGKVSVDGRDISGMRIEDRIRLGISRTFQTPRLDLRASVADAVMLGFTPREPQSLLQAVLPFSRARATEARLRARAEALIDEFQLTTDPDMPAGELSLGRLRLLEVARALASEPRYLLLDEPAAGIDDVDRGLLASAIRKAAGRGLGVLLVEHNVAFVADLSDRMLALVNGRVVAQGVPSAVVSDPQVVSAYLGEQRVAA